MNWICQNNCVMLRNELIRQIPTNTNDENTFIFL